MGSKEGLGVPEGEYDDCHGGSDDTGGITDHRVALLLNRRLWNSS